VSIEALNWALNEAPIPTDKHGRSPSCTAVLIGLANHAHPDGRHAHPSVATLMRYTSLSERAVRTALDRLEEFGTIRPGDPDVVAAHIKRADQRTKPYDLALERVDETRKPQKRGAATAPRVENGVQQVPNGVQPLQERGAATAPEPYIEPTTEPHRVSPAVAVEPATLDLDLEEEPRIVVPLLATAILNQWWESFTPRPTAVYAGQRKILVRLLEAGWTAEQVKAALRGVTPPLTLAYMERRLRGTDQRPGLTPAHDWQDGDTWLAPGSGR
jgi:hypothetical protein